MILDRSETSLRIGIDASNLRAGGGVSHLTEILRHFEPSSYGVEKIIIWGGECTFDQLAAGAGWLVKKHVKDLDGNLPRRKFWQQYRLTAEATWECCNILFNAGGGYTGKFRPFVTMPRNMLLFEREEMQRYGLSLAYARLLLLRRFQLRSLKLATGVIVLNEYSMKLVETEIPNARPKVRIIPHGVSERFFVKPRNQKPISHYTFDEPFKLLYVSTVDEYKHQWTVIDAVGRLRDEQQLPIALTLVGRAYGPAMRRMYEAMNRIDPARKFIRYEGAAKFADLPEIYRQADGFLFASTCETLPNILLEAMASGLPILCSNRGVMPSIVGDAGHYFDPENLVDIAVAMKEFLESDQLRASYAERAYLRAQNYSWDRCASATFGFLCQLANIKSLRTAA